MKSAGSSQPFLKRHLLKQKIGYQAPQASIFKMQLTGRPALLGGGVWGPVHRRDRSGRLVCSVSLPPAVVRHHTYIQSLGNVALEPTLSSHLLRPTKQANDFCF
jgi:hypothetical protein